MFRGIPAGIQAGRPRFPLRFFRVDQHSLSPYKLDHIPLHSDCVPVFVLAAAVHGRGQTARCWREDLDVRLAKKTQRLEFVTHPDDITGCFPWMSDDQIGSQADRSGKPADDGLKKMDKPFEDRKGWFFHQAENMVLGVFRSDSQKLPRMVAQEILKE